MSDDAPKAQETPEETPKPGLGLLFIAAALALALVLAFVALMAFVAFSPRQTVNPPSHGAATKAAPEGRLPSIKTTPDAARERIVRAIGALPSREWQEATTVLS
jgi:hypothetical protein